MTQDVGVETLPTTSPAASDLPVTLDDVLAARDRIAGLVHRTPVLRSETLSAMTGTRLGLKAENFQKTGSFKARGALNALMQLSPEQRERGIVTLSAGNHGQGLAWAAARFGVRCAVFMPEAATPSKVAAIRGYGAEAHFAPVMERVFAAMEAHREAHGMHFIHPFGDPAIIAGQGTVGLEILEDAPDTEAISVCVGGGGLLAGIAVAVKSQRPDIRIVGAEPEGAPTVSRGLAAGEPVILETIRTVADGLAAPFGAETTQAIIARLVDDVVVLTDDEIVAALRLILERAKVLVEPAGAAAVAALLNGAAGIAPGTPTIATLSGGNIDSGRLRELL
ncbi:MAG: Threonine dehydratase [uncultured Thermomicrobiales bacterium]|uniref:Threonine dehydratase n=1 Tax=uncultured Thermomicrobiales bacterium TaxID=1645740 RepID=A0A6J4U723_9BACT|nr:MAG: Threonine dehydratase [uncultured Thermomicrobiales bacterium]